MFELYIANKNYSSWSLRPWLLMQHLAIPFTEHLVTFADHDSFSRFRSFSPSGKVPCLIQNAGHPGSDSELKHVVIWDSLAITEYLYENYNAVWPADKGSRAWARCASAEIHANFNALRSVCSMNCGLRIQLHAQSPALIRDLARLDELLNEGLTTFGGPFLAGPTFTAVDAFYAPVAFRLQSYGISLSASAMQYINLLLSLPGMQTWYQQALAEPWIDQAHDEEIGQYGKITADLRHGLVKSV